MERFMLYKITLFLEIAILLYLSTMPYFQQKYIINEWEVVGLWFGARGAVSEFLIQFFNSHGLKTADNGYYKKCSRSNRRFVGDNPLTFLYVRSHSTKIYIIFFLFNVILFYYSKIIFITHTFAYLWFFTYLLRILLIYFIIWLILKYQYINCYCY